MGYVTKQNPDGSTSLQNTLTSAEVLKLDKDDNIVFNKSTSLGSSARSKSTLFDDFDQNAINTFNWSLRAGSDAQAVVAVVNAQAGGSARLVTGNDATTTMAVNGSQLEGQLNYLANKDGLIFEARIKMSAIINVSIFIGLTDQVSALEAPIISAASVDTITTNASDAVGFMFDTAMATDNWFLTGVKANTDATHQNTTKAPVADTYQILRIEVDSTGGAKFFIDNALVGTAMSNAVTASVALAPVLTAFTLSAASATIDMDYIFVQQDR